MLGSTRWSLWSFASFLGTEERRLRTNRASSGTAVAAARTVSRRATGGKKRVCEGAQ